MIRLCVRALPPSRGLPSGRPLPSARLVSCDGFIGTMNRSDSRPRLGCALRQCLARIPRRRPSRRTRSGLSCSNDHLPCMIRPSTPAERRRLAYRRRTCCLRQTGTGSASAIFHLSRLYPAPCTTPVYTSDPALPRRPQDSVPACPLRLWLDRTFTDKSSLAWHDVLPLRGVAGGWPATISGRTGSRVSPRGPGG